MSLVVNPYSYFTDTNGNALNGYLYVGEVGKNAENYPIAIFYDALFTTPAPNPLTVSAGYIYNSGTIAQIYASADYSMVVKKTDGSLVYSSLNESGMTNGAIANIDEMKDFVAPYNNYALNVLGYSEAGDGGGGLFYYDASSTEADNGGTIIEPTSGSGRWIRQYSGAVNVKWFGAKGDGITDDSTYIQNAIYSAEDVFISNGTYILNSPIEIYYGNITGDSHAIIKASSSLSGHIFKIETGSTYVSKVISNLIIDGNSNATTGIKILNSFGGVKFDTITFKNFDAIGAYCVFLGNCWFYTFDNCDFRNGYNGIYGGYLTGELNSSFSTANCVNQIKIEKCRFEDISNMHIHFTQGNNIRIDSSSFTGNTNNVINYSGGLSLSVFDTTIINNDIESLCSSSVISMSSSSSSSCYNHTLIANRITQDCNIYNFGKASNIFLLNNIIPLTLTGTHKQISTTVDTGNINFFDPLSNSLYFDIYDISKVQRLNASGSLSVNDISLNNVGSLNEVGTWTPIIKFGGNNTGVTYTGHGGRYVKIGKFVTANFYMSIFDKGSSTGIVAIDGLPYTPNSLIWNGSYGGTSTSNNNGFGMVFALEGGSTQFYVYKSTTMAQVTNSDLVGTPVIYGYVSFEVA